MSNVNLKNLYSADQVMSLDEILDSLEFAAFSTRRVEEKKVAQKPRRKRKTKFPKGIDPLDPKKPAPDPERWVPKTLRSDFLRKHKKKRGEKLTGAHQGSYNPALAGQERSSVYKGPSTAHIQAMGEKPKPRHKR